MTSDRIFNSMDLFGFVKIFVLSPMCLKNIQKNWYNLLRILGCILLCLTCDHELGYPAVLLISATVRQDSLTAHQGPEVEKPERLIGWVTGRLSTVIRS